MNQRRPNITEAHLVFRFAHCPLNRQKISNCSHRTCLECNPHYQGFLILDNEINFIDLKQVIYIVGPLEVSNICIFDWVILNL